MWNSRSRRLPVLQQLRRKHKHKPQDKDRRKDQPHIWETRLVLHHRLPAGLQPLIGKQTHPPEVTQPSSSCTTATSSKTQTSKLQDTDRLKETQLVLQFGLPPGLQPHSGKQTRQQ